MDQTVVIRRAAPDDARGIARVHVASWRTTYRGIVADDLLDNLSVDRRAAFWSSTLSDPDDASVNYVAVDADGRIVGFASGGPERDGTPGFGSELYAIYLLEAFQGQGLGQRLVAPVVSALLDAGRRSMLVWVLAANPAREFYARLGGRQVASKQVAMGRDDLEEVAYGWDDLSALAASLTSD